MLSMALILISLAGSRALDFNITELIVPQFVPPGQNEVEIECHYDADFTLLNWFKGSNEFFRYRPGAAPSTRSFPTPGVGRVEVINCGPTACRLRLGSLTEDASGMYKCDLERDVPPYTYNTRSAYMAVHSHERRRPLLEGLAEDFEEGQRMQAYCRAAPGAEIRWYTNGHEVEEMRGSAVLNITATRFIFTAVPPTVIVQCAEFRNGKLSGSKGMKATWKKNSEMQRVERPQEQKNGSKSIQQCTLFLIFVYYFSTFL